MGMFDTISNKFFCPYCGAKIPGNYLQTKDTDCLGITPWSIEDLIKFYPLNDIIHIYSDCPKCKKWISLNLELRRLNYVYKIERYEDIEMREKASTNKLAQEKLSKVGVKGNPIAKGRK